VPSQRAVALAVACTLIAGASPGSADVVVGRDARTAVALTIYAQQDLALVRETRRTDLGTGDATLRFTDVAARLDPRTVMLRATDDPASLAVLEQSYRYDLASPQTVVERWVGREVELVESDERLRTRVTQGTLLSTDGGNTYRIGDRIAVGHPGWLLLPPGGEEVFTRPTLRWQLANRGAAARTLEVSYATGGLAWSADYVLTLAADEQHADLSAWATLANQSGTSYDDASVTLIAGQLNRAVPPRRPVAYKAAEAMDAVAAAPPSPEPQAFGEYYRYAFERRTGLAENETKQLPLLEVHDVAVAKRYELTSEAWWIRQPMRDPDRRVPVTVSLTLANTAANKLGRDLPAGTVRVFQADTSGARQLVGEDQLRQTARDETAEITLGSAADVVATRVQTDWRSLSVEPFQAESAYEVTVRNQKATPVTVVVRDRIDGEWQVLDSSLPSRKEDARTLAFDVPVPAGGQTMLRYRLRAGR
jgi:hypothetical protein